MVEHVTRPVWDQMDDCPFCGAKASENNISVSYSTGMTDAEPKHWFGECSECGAMGPIRQSEAAAFGAWCDRASARA